MANLLGKEAGLLMQTASMSNLAAIMTRCKTKEGCIAGDRSHIIEYEAGSISAVARCFPMVFKMDRDGTMDLVDIAAKIPE